MKLKVGDLVQVGIDISDGVFKEPDDGISWNSQATICVIKEVHQQYGKLAFYTIFSPDVLPMVVFPYEIRKL